MNFNTQGCDVFLLEFSRQMALDEGCLYIDGLTFPWAPMWPSLLRKIFAEFTDLAGSAITDENEFERRRSLSSGTFGHGSRNWGN